MRTKYMAAADKGWAARAHRAATLAKANTAATAAQTEEYIEGPEGLKNRMSDVEAGWSKLHYDRIAKARQADINHDAEGSIGIDQSIVDSTAAGPGMSTPTGLDFTPPLSPNLRVPTTAFQNALAGASLAEIPNEADEWETPVHDYDAVTDSTPDHLDAGEVMDSFAKNADKVRNEIESKAADRIDFTNGQRVARRDNYKKAADAVAADRKSVEEAREEDRAEVKETRETRQKVIDEARERVKDAKQAAEAHAIKKVQAERAAALGRRVGAIEGADAARHAWADYRSDVAAENE